jgi:hypothetical protein
MDANQDQPRIDTNGHELREFVWPRLAAWIIFRRSFVDARLVSLRTSEGGSIPGFNAGERRPFAVCYFGAPGINLLRNFCVLCMRCGSALPLVVWKLRG